MMVQMCSELGLTANAIIIQRDNQTSNDQDRCFELMIMVTKMTKMAKVSDEMAGISAARPADKDDV